MGLSSSKSTSKTTSNDTQQGTTTPFNLPGVDQALMDYTDKIQAFGNMDPNSFVAGASPLQQMAWQNAGSLADWQPQARLASEQALGVAQGAPVTAGAAQAWNPTQGQAQTGQAANAGAGALVSARGYQAPTLGASSGYAAPRVGAPIGAQSQFYSTQPTARTTIDPTRDAQATDAQSQSLLTGLQDYQNPFNEQVTANALQDFDLNAGETRARQAAEAARGGAFGGSRFGIAQAQTEDNLARARGSLDAQMRAEGFNQATGLSQSDAANRQQTSLFNAQNQTGVSAANAAATNARAMAQAGLGQNENLFDAGARNQAAADAAGSRERTSMFNTGNDQQRLLAQAGLEADSSRFGAENANQFALERAGMGERAGQFNANLGAQADLANQSSANNFSQFNAGNQQQMNLANMNAGNQFGMANMDAANAAGQFNAGQGNQFALANAQFANQGQDRQLAAAGLMGDIANQYGAGVRSDLGMMAGLGDQQRNIEQQYAMAPLAQLQEMGNLYGTTPYGLFAGQNINTTGTSQGTNVQKTSPSLFNTMLAGASMFG